ncbi:MAG: hypothetical protein WEC84_00805 [Candidatus Andersenbacteria bacterium]
MMSKLRWVINGGVVTLMLFAPHIPVTHAVSFSDSFDRVDTIETGSGVEKYTEAEAFIRAVVRIILAFVSILAVAAIIVGGVMYLVSGGDEDKAKKAKKLILAAIIGLVVIGVAGLAVNTIVEFFAE